MDRLKYEDLKLPNYINSREVFAGLNVSDLARASVISGLNLLLVGDTGTGKSQLASDVYMHWFGGNKAEGGNGVFIRMHPDVDVYNEVFTALDIERAQRKLTNNSEALVYFLDETNRAPPIAQNQIFGIGDGKMDYQGRGISLGKNGYHIMIAASNIGNGEFKGTFDTDKALMNRLHVALDLEYGPFKPTYNDKIQIRRREANPNVILASASDISDKIIQASKEISESTRNSDLETQAVLDYIETGLENCQRYGIKDRVWPMGCQDCQFNKNNDSSCSMIKSPSPRTMQVVRKYASALEYLAKLKNPNVQVDSHELIFKAFELTGAYQHLLNSGKLREHYNHNPRLMAEVVEKLKNDYESQRDFIISSLEESRRGNKVVRFFIHNRAIGNYDNLSEKARKNVNVIEPFTNQREVGLNYVNELVESVIKEGAKQ